MKNKVRLYFIEKLMGLENCDELEASELLDEILQWRVDGITRLLEELNTIDENDIEALTKWINKKH